MDLSRRDFVKSAAVFSSITFIPSSVFGANERVNVALVGIGGKGVNTLKNINGHCNLVAFADCDDNPDRSGVSRRAYPDIPLYRDFRVMLDKHDKDIDAVIVATPDHTHHYIAMTSIARGKHVYVEKPMAHNIREVRDLMAAEKETGLVCQMGNQGQSGNGIDTLRGWVDAGVLGDITEVKAWCNSNWGKDRKRLSAQPIPETMSWDLWLGPTAKVPYNKGYCPGLWRGWNEFGSGNLGDFSAHNMDAPYDVLGLDCPSQVKIESTGRNELSFPKSTQLTYTFDAPKYGRILFKWYEGKTFRPERPEGMDPRRRLGSTFGGTLIVGSKATVMMGSHSSSPRIVPESLNKEMKSLLPKVVGEKKSHHHLNWLRACKGQEKCRSPFSYAGRLTETMLYGLIAMKVDRDIKIDPKKRTIIGDEEAAKQMSWPSSRKGWEIA